jgi:acyl carrier protein
MQTTDIEREIHQFLVDKFFFGRVEKLRNDGSLLGGVIDSTGILDLVVFLQDRFTITVEDEEVVPDNLDSVNSLVAYVETKLRSNVQGPPCV